jgi:hypothetical protein
MVLMKTIGGITTTATLRDGREDSIVKSRWRCFTCPCTKPHTEPLNACEHAQAEKILREAALILLNQLSRHLAGPEKAIVTEMSINDQSFADKGKRI